MINVISFCLYGSKATYILGMKENILLGKKYFPNWEIRIYHNETVPEKFIKEYCELGANCIKYDNIGKNKMNWEGMLWRFMPLDDNDVHHWISRDADSRLSKREADIVNQWIQSDKTLHCIRDHKCHYHAIMGGMFGINNKLFHEKYKLKKLSNVISDLYKYYKERPYNVDQEFLNDKLWNLLKDDVMAHISNKGRRIYNSDIEIPSVPDFIGKQYRIADFPEYINKKMNKNKGCYWKTSTDSKVYWSNSSSNIKKDIEFSNQDEYFVHRAENGYPQNWSQINVLDGIDTKEDKPEKTDKLSLHKIRIQDYNNIDNTYLPYKCDWNYANNRLIGDESKQPKTIFIKVEFIEAFYNSYYRKIEKNNRFIIVSGGGDVTMPNNLDIRFKDLKNIKNNKKIISEMLKDERLIHWYAENCDEVMEKLLGIPTGVINNTELNNYYNSQLELTRKINFHNKINVLCCHRVRNWTHTRKKVDDLCKNEWKSLITYEQSISQSSFLDEISKYTFILCVEGGGLDPSPKAFEAIIAGVIPIIKKTDGIYSAYKDLPVVFIEDWIPSEITEDKLTNWLATLRKYYEDDKLRRETLYKLSDEYWWNYIINPKISVNKPYKNVYILDSPERRINPIGDILDHRFKLDRKVKLMEKYYLSREQKQTESLVSIAISTFESGGKGHELLKHNLEHILMQDYGNIEIVISDHSSDNKIKDLCQEYNNKKYPIKYIHNPHHKGNSSQNTNNAINHCSGEYIKILFMDDYLYNDNAISIIVKKMQENPDKKWLIHSYKHTKNYKDFYNLHHPKFSHDMIFCNRIGCPSCLTIHKSVTERFDEKLKWFMDSELYSRIRSKYNEPIILHTSDSEKPLMINLHHDGQVSNTSINSKLVNDEKTYIKKKNVDKPIFPGNWKDPLSLDLNTSLFTTVGSTHKLTVIHKICDWCIGYRWHDNALFGNTNKLPKRIFVYQNSFRFFYNKIYSLIPNTHKYSLIIADDDCSVPVNYDKRFKEDHVMSLGMWEDIINNPQIKHIFVTKLSVKKTDKYSPLPVGFNPAEFKTNSPDFLLNLKVNLDIRNKLPRVLYISRIRNHKERIKIRDICKNSWGNFCDIKYNIEKSDFFDVIKNYSFMICDTGDDENHIDPNPKLFTCLYLGIIPIIKKFINCEEMYSDLPIMYIDDWSSDNISLERLLQFRLKTEPYFYDSSKRKKVLEKLSCEYWINKILKYDQNLI